MRKLTLKSKLGYGKYGDLTIQSILNIRGYKYLAWVYYCQSEITFMDDVLALIGISQKINKPGKEVDLYNLIKKGFAVTETKATGNTKWKRMLFKKTEAIETKDKLKARNEGRYGLAPLSLSGEISRSSVKNKTIE